MGIDDPAELLQLLRAEGYELVPVAGRLRVTHPVRPLPDAWREAICRHRDALVDLLVEETAANLRAVSTDEQAGRWSESVPTLVPAEGKRPTDPYLVHDRHPPRRIVPPGVCLHCDRPCPRDGCHWCEDCRRRITSEAGGDP